MNVLPMSGKAIRPNIFDIYRQAEEESYKTVAYGFIFDNTKVDRYHFGALNNIKNRVGGGD